MKSTPRLRVVLAAAGLLAATASARTQQVAGPSIDEVISLERVGSPAISPNGQQVAYTIRETNWDENAYET